LESSIASLPGEHSFLRKIAKKAKIHVHNFAGNAIALTAIFARRPTEHLRAPGPAQHQEDYFMARPDKPRADSPSPAPDQERQARVPSAADPSMCTREDERRQKAIIAQVTRLAELAGCQTADTVDAQQLAATKWLAEAEAAFDPAKHPSFLSFLALVVGRRFHDFLRACRRRARQPG
jgi:hypothetical protein